MKVVIAVFLALAAVSSASVIPIVIDGVPLSLAGVHPIVWQAVSAPVPAVQIVALQPQAVAVSATRGAVHVAPLPGHSASATQLNLEEAPGA